MPVVETGIGPNREIWFAKVNDPTTKWSFLVRDDASSKAITPVGRSIRLGDPINVGPNSNWQQLTWEGGVKQEVWKDDQMFQEGSADVDTKVGKVRMWPGWEKIYGEKGRTIHGHILARGGGGGGAMSAEAIAAGQGLSPYFLYMGETDGHGLSFPFPPFSPYAGWVLRQYDPYLNRVLDMKSFNYPITNILPVNSEAEFLSGWLCVTPLAGRMSFINEGSFQYEEDPNSVDVQPGLGWYFYNSMAYYNGAIYYVVSQVLRKRTSLPPYGVVGEHSDVKQFLNAWYVNALAVHQNRLWFSVTAPGFKTGIYTSDGNVVNEAFKIPDEFMTWSICSHYGSLYIAGGKQTRQGFPSLGSVAQVWKYNGSSLVKLWEQGGPDTNQWAQVRKIIGVGPWVIWGRTATPGGTEEDTAKRPGIMMYNVEKDALFEGPSLDPDPAIAADSRNTVFVDELEVFRGRIVASVRDLRAPVGINNLNDVLRSTPQQWQDALYRNVAVLSTRIKDQVRNSIVIPGENANQGFQYQPATKSQYVLSSRYDGGGDTSAETKTWLAGRLRVKVPTTNDRVRVAVLMDEGTSETVVSTVNFDPDERGWRTVTFPVKGGYARLSGGAGGRVSTPDSAGVSVTGDIDIRVRCSLDDWTPAAVQRLVSKLVTAGNQRSYSFYVDPTGQLELSWSPDGTSGAALTAVSSAPTGFTDGTPHWVRATMDVNDGAGNRVIKFYTSNDKTNDSNAVSWTQLGSTITTPGTTSIFDSTAELAVGGFDFGSGGSPTGNFYAVEVRSGIDGTVVASPAFSDSPTFTDTQGNLWTIQSPATRLSDYLSSAVLQYKVYIDSLSTVAESTAEVDSVDIEWQVQPKRRRTWRYRTVCQDAQLRLDGTANSLTTAKAQSDKLEELFSSKKPILFWEADPSGAVPVSPGVEVNPNDFNEFSYRTDTEQQDVQREVNIAVTENVTV